MAHECARARRVLPALRGWRLDGTVESGAVKVGTWKGGRR
jgi:hypothetical protein